MKFLDIEFDNEIMKIRLFLIKLQRARDLVVATTIAIALSQQNLEVLVDFLFFCVKVVILERAFLSILYVFLAKDTRYHRVIVSIIRNIA